MTDRPKRNLEIEFDGLGFYVKPPEGLNFKLPLESKIKIESLEKQSDELHAKFLKGLERMNLKISMTKDEVEYQNWLLSQLKKIVLIRSNIYRVVSSEKIEAAKLFLDVLSRDFKSVTPMTPATKNTVKKPSKRWKK